MYSFFWWFIAAIFIRHRYFYRYLYFILIHLYLYLDWYIERIFIFDKALIIIINIYYHDIFRNEKYKFLLRNKKKRMRMRMREWEQKWWFFNQNFPLNNNNNNNKIYIYIKSKQHKRKMAQREKNGRDNKIISRKKNNKSTIHFFVFEK